MAFKDLSKPEKLSLLDNLTWDYSVTPEDLLSIISLILRSFQEGTDYSDGTDIIALVEERRKCLP